MPSTIYVCTIIKADRYVRTLAATTPRGLEDLMLLLGMRGGNEDWDGSYLDCGESHMAQGDYWAMGPADEVIGWDHAQMCSAAWDDLYPYTTEAQEQDPNHIPVL